MPRTSREIGVASIADRVLRSVDFSERNDGDFWFPISLVGRRQPIAKAVNVQISTASVGRKYGKANTVQR